MKKSVIKALGLIIVAALALTGCKKAVEYDYDPGVVITEPAPDDTVVSDATEPNDQVEESQDTTDTGEEDVDVDLISDIDLLNMLIDASNTIEISVIVANLCGVDIGMVAILDPFTEEQLNLGPLAADEVMNISEYWPMDKTTFDIAIYNVAGDLVASSAIDVTGIQESVTITFSGDGDLENVDSRVE